MTRRPRPCSVSPARAAGADGSSPLVPAQVNPCPVSRQHGVAALPWLALIAATLLLPGPAVRAGVRFENCVQGSDGSISCDTVPTGNTYLNDKDAQYGLLQQASPGWAEFNPYQGYDEDFGGGQD